MSKSKTGYTELNDIQIHRMITKYRTILNEIRSTGEDPENLKEWLQYQIWYWKYRLTGIEPDLEGI